MPCFHPHSGWKTWSGETILGNQEPKNARSWLPIPCGTCIYCRQAKAQAWALRCQLELQQHETAAFTTLTYDDAHLPDTLVKRDLQLWLKRLRRNIQRTASNRTIRFFAAAEYGETTGRPHYHVITFGLSAQEDHLIDDAWGLGLTRTYPANNRTIAYTAGYTAKKREPKFRLAHHDRPRLDRTGTYFYRWQNPFFQMSRRPGLAAHAKQYTDSWRLYSIQNGFKKPVPRYLHEAWKAQATPLQLEELEQEKYELTNTHRYNAQQLNAQEKITQAKHAITAARKQL